MDSSPFEDRASEASITARDIKKGSKGSTKSPTDAQSRIDRIFVVQRVRAFYRGDRSVEVAGVFVSLRDANDMVRRCKKEFKQAYEIPEPENGDEEYGFKYVDLGDEFDGSPDPAGTTVGLYWEFDEWEQFDAPKGWFSCRVECFPLMWPQKTG